jgi:hypothetical protein
MSVEHASYPVTATIQVLRIPNPLARFFDFKPDLRDQEMKTEKFESGND